MTTLTPPRALDAQLLALPLGYEAMTAKQVVALLPSLDHGARTAVQSHEQAARRRTTVLREVDRLDTADGAKARALDSTPPPYLPLAPALGWVAPVASLPALRQRRHLSGLTYAALTAGLVATACVVGTSGIGW